MVLMEDQDNQVRICLRHEHGKKLDCNNYTPTTGIDGPDGGSGHPASGSEDLIGKKNRVRPKKYDSDGNLRVQPFHHHKAVPRGALTSPPAGFSFSPSPPSDGLISSLKRCRGRPPGSGNWQLLASLGFDLEGELFANTAGGDFTPHVGRFEIISLSGSFTVTETGGVRSRTGGLSVSLASPDGRVIGCRIAGLLLAASPIQIVVGSFMPNGYKAHKRKHHRENAIGSRIPAGAQDVPTEARPISEAKPVGETCLISASSLPEQSHEGADNSASDQQISNAANPFTPV
ncbi:hypothetical protein GH714_029679 [Hevea brasiliensis]|uniref:AT-hook motif nuclear-localized protein n=1 Tax=Hevea brasiliensis TaxID=3981 RepID=A0A6A6M5L5_HEVBR|nr:hypothetical protein GH714_029679 [Hevea brasiliensis]